MVVDGVAGPGGRRVRTCAEEELERLARLLALRVAVAVPDWVRRCVERGVANGKARAGPYWTLDAEASKALSRSAELVGWRAAEFVERKLWEVLAAVGDTRPAQPRVVAVLQEAGAYPAGVLARAGVPAARRDRAAMRLFPDDAYDIVPRSLAELHPMLPELVNAWEEARWTVVCERNAAAG